MRRFRKVIDMLRSQRNWLSKYWVFTAVAPIFVAMIGKAEEPESIFFHDDYNQAIEEARLTKKPLFLEFRCAP